MPVSSETPDQSSRWDGPQKAIAAFALVMMPELGTIVDLISSAIGYGERPFEIRVKQLIESAFWAVAAGAAVWAIPNSSAAERQSIIDAVLNRRRSRTAPQVVERIVEVPVPAMVEEPVPRPADKPHYVLRPEKPERSPGQPDHP